MGGGAGILAELGVAQQGYVFNPIEGGTVQILRKALVPKHGEPFLERQLEPVAAGDAVTGPVVEILVADHTFDALQLAIGGGFRIG